MRSRSVLVSRLIAGRFARSAALLVPVAVAMVALSSCSVIHAVHAIETGNKEFNNLTKQLQTNENTKYSVTYETTGSSPSTVQYAADPPTDFAFITPGSNGSGSQEIIQNPSGYYDCTQNSSSSGGSSGAWQCVKIESAQQNTYAGLYQFYTGAYWATIFSALSTLAAFEGYSIKSTTMSVNGFNLNCVVIKGPTTTTQNENANGTFCVTSQGILGYVSSQGSSSAFEIKAYTSSPPSSLFQLPAGATITTLPSGVTGGSTTSTVAGGTGTGNTGTGNTGTGNTGSGNTGTGGTGTGGTGTGGTGNTGNTTTST